MFQADTSKAKSTPLNRMCTKFEEKKLEYYSIIRKENKISHIAQKMLIQRIEKKNSSAAWSSKKNSSSQNTSPPERRFDTKPATLPYFTAVMYYTYIVLVLSVHETSKPRSYKPQKKGNIEFIFRGTWTERREAKIKFIASEWATICVYR